LQTGVCSQPPTAYSTAWAGPIVRESPGRASGRRPARATATAAWVNGSSWRSVPVSASRSTAADSSSRCWPAGPLLTTPVAGAPFCLSCEEAQRSLGRPFTVIKLHPVCLQARSSKSPCLAPARNSFHSALVYVKTGPSGMLVWPSTTESPWRATMTHAPLSHVRETRQDISPGADGYTDMISPSLG
jgi:hypothetical protein